MLAVVSTGFICVGLVITSRNSVNWSKYKVTIGLTGAFVFWQVLVLFISGGEIYQQLFGSQGRNTGFITYLAFSFIFIGSVIAATAKLLKRIVFIVFVVGSASLGYGVVQAVGADPYNWVNAYSPVFGFSKRRMSRQISTLT